MTISQELYQQLILDHNKNPRNFGVMKTASHKAEGFNPVCGDHYHVFADVGADGVITEVKFDGTGCAISKASASLMTQAIKGKTVAEAKAIFEQFHAMVLRKLDPDKDENKLGKLAVFSGIWQYPARVKCAALSWHTLNGALNESQEPITTE